MIRSPEKYRTEGGGGERNDQILLLNYLYTIGNQSPMVISIRLFPDVSPRRVFATGGAVPGPPSRPCPSKILAHSAPPSLLRCRLRASILANIFPHGSHEKGRQLLECSYSCLLQSCCRAKALPHPGHGQTNGVSSL